MPYLSALRQGAIVAYTNQRLPYLYITLPSTSDQRRARLVLGWVTVHGYESHSHRFGI